VLKKGTSEPFFRSKCTSSQVLNFGNNNLHFALCIHVAVDAIFRRVPLRWGRKAKAENLKSRNLSVRLLQGRKLFVT